MAQNLYRIEIGGLPRHGDAVGRRTAREIRDSLNLPARDARVIKIFTLGGLDRAEAELLLERAALHDPVLQRASLEPLLPADADWVVEVSCRPGVTDNEGHTARDTAALVLGRDRASLRVYTANQYHIWGDLTRQDANRAARDMLANELIQRFRVKSREEWRDEPGFAPLAAEVTGVSSDRVDEVPLSLMDDAALAAYSSEHTLALSLKEMRAVRDWFGREEVLRERESLGLGREPTDAELEVLAQTWSEH